MACMRRSIPSFMAFRTGVPEGVNSLGQQLIGGYRHYGLHREDILNAETDYMQETLRRLPKAVLAAREARIKLALELDFKGEILPESEWTPEELDSQTYLVPYLAEVKQEIAERASWRS